MVDDGILNAGDCTDPCNLSQVAEVVAQKTGSQRDLVRALPTTEFRNAKPNPGHLIAVALMVEGAVSNIVTLNFDLAFSHALSELGIRNEVVVLNGPEDHAHMGQRNIIYLHRSVDSPPEAWILTKESLDHAWKDGWEESMARFATLAPVTVFAGLGSSCGVLTYSSQKLRNSLKENAVLLLADPGDPANSHFVQEVGIEICNCIRCGWVDFMSQLAERFVRKVLSDVRSEGQVLAVREQWVASNKDYEKLLEPLLVTLYSDIENLGLLGLGELRAAWFQEYDRYSTTDPQQIGALADLVVAIAFILHHESGSAQFHEDGTVSISFSSGPEVRIILASGWRKHLRWNSLETALKERVRRRRRGASTPQKVLASGVTGKKTSETTAPMDIVGSTPSDSIIDADGGMLMWSIDDLREDPRIIQEIMS
ncbi:SIR2 family protein [Bremerella sp. T1]|uniref:hypothetical protein n=1 Tax=Bremerella sp. TYQ1 TaxID=3119568 RepID=UPI001CCE38CC|nr:hypothetical protein [Bremerella volcania]UBM33744.1 hypothetical protein LA756_13685 [Bremerella volcania]